MIHRLSTAAVLLSLLGVPAWGDDGDKPAVKNPFEGDKTAVEAGHHLFNETCSHCHGPDAVTTISERNLRKLKVRYGGEIAAVFSTTVTKGRLDAGMPAWGPVLDQKTIWQIYTYLESVQVQD